MKKHFIFLIVALFSSNVFSQEFNLATVGFEADVTVDYFSNEIYIAPWTNGRVGKYEFINNSAIATDFEGLPVFMHNSHKSINLHVSDSSNAYYLRDFENGSKKLLFEYIFGSSLAKTTGFYKPYYSISPDDKYLFLGNLFVIEDSSWISPIDEVSMYGYMWPYSWSGDSTFVYLSYTNEISEYNFYTKTIDTLLFHNEEDIILNLDYNIKEDLLAYTIENKFYVFDNKSKSNILEFEGPTWGWNEIYDLKWNEDETKIAFLSYDYTNPISIIYIYEIYSNKVFAVPNSDYGLKTSLQWLNNDTLVYISGNNLVGFNISGLTDIEENLTSSPNEFILYQNYPNPFNPSTVVIYSIPLSTEYYSAPQTTLKIYDILGREVATLVNESQKAGKYQVNFNASNLSSGIYYYTLQSGSFKESKKMIFLK